MSRSFTYTLVPGIFIQDEPGHIPSNEQIAPKFGLIGETWPDLDALNANAPEGTAYKLVFAGRHGQGYHNVAEAKYGTKAWNEYWSLLYGDGEIVWGPDPLLTSTGIDQARNAASVWSTHTGPRPSLYLCSPLRRTLRTFALTFAGTSAVVRVREGVREHLTGHTCDVRLKVSELQEFLRDENEDSMFTWGEFEGVENDPYEKVTENDEDVQARAKKAIDRIFSEESAQVVSITSHSGFIQGLSIVLGRQNWVLPTGGVAPFLIKAVETTA